MAQVNPPSIKRKFDEDKNVDKSTWRLLHSSAALIIRVLIFYALSIGLTFYQQWFLRRYRIPLATVAIHMFIKFMMALLCRMIYNLWKGEKRVSLPWKETPKFALTGFSGGLDIAFSQWGLSLVTVSLYTMTKSTSIIAVLLFAILLRLEKMSWSILYIVGLISFGLLLFTYKSTQFHFYGFLLVLSASIFSGLRWTTTQFVSTKKNLNIHNPVDLIYYIQPWMFVANAILALIFERIGISKIWTHYDRVNLAFYTFTGATIAFGLEFAEYLLIIHTSSLTFSVTGIVKEMFTLLLGYAWAMDEVSFINFLGLVICLCGVAGHIVYKTSRMETIDTVEFVNDETQLESSQPPSHQSSSITFR